jgi:hypothetical protein
VTAAAARRAQSRITASCFAALSCSGFCRFVGFRRFDHFRQS